MEKTETKEKESPEEHLSEEEEYFLKLHKEFNDDGC